jgi:hypothetical protein
MKKMLMAMSVVAVMVSAPVLADRPGGLPPGLQKKAAHGNLPPGWQKKLVVGHRLDSDVYRYGRVVVPVDDRGYVTVQIEDRRLRLIAATLEIIDILN